MKMGVNFDYYKVFYFVAKCKNISMAAKMLYLSQPTVSYSIHNLEKELGCTLFIRTKKGVILTPEGKMLYMHVEKACEHLFQAEEEVKEVHNMERGVVRIGASVLTLHHYLLPYLEKFRNDYPHIRLKISNLTTPASIRALEGNFIDFAIVVMNSTKGGGHLTIRELSKLQDIVVAGKKYEFLKGKEIRLSALKKYPIICMEEGTSTRKYIDKIFHGSGTTLVPDIELATTDLVMPMVERNLGIGFVPEDFARESLKNEKVFQIQLKEKIGTRSICLVCDPENPVSVPGQKFLEYLDKKE